ncbi:MULTISPECIES: glycerophosphodiester phosphodiesterase [Paenarthrobacter]|jgi:glycerophosphoryl diester phosphodiesterase|uniref:glycerophosphodiester phosphodiesterase n=1 Tax=Paenarthrobacter TaxID=1742992 RepID=UPI00140B0722|nr:MULTISPECIES: glycerophosphodiester phosphodiesterase family protein [Paenarthrobacter]MCX8455902.1 glycerophosphodiester phosphodiesterase family protein [Paenarthrobacter ureafaciens]MCY0974867.1 glycerophosphodiester phosphodiesterase family protein [Paenarthrobacter ureafaciens]QOT18494.1 hypothetical protein HMI59_19090 [Paenarthrobacter sp. YJN-5]QQQ62661.1 hypothetical protein JHQ56_01985 [Paenarthrobacter ureafaciens]UOD81687.1 hypothetical protein MQZ73_01980 [Paenarthrobacter urea
MIEIQGHRGVLATQHGNTLASFVEALTLGVDAIEVDIWLTSDRQLALRHDAVVNGRDIRDGRLREAVVEVLPDAVHRIGIEARTPTLEELLALMRFAGADDVVLDIEVKTDRAKGREYSHSIVWWLASILRVHESGQALRVRSFDPLVIKAMGEEIPSVPRVALCREAVGPDPGLYPSDTCALIEAALAAGAEAVAPEVNLLDEKLVARAHAAGLKVYPWTLVTEEQIANAVSLGVDGVCVNDVALARATFAGLGQEVPVPRPISLPILR